MTKKAIYFFILAIYLLLTLSCTDSVRSQVRIENDTDYTITDIDFADEDYSSLSSDKISSYKWVSPNSYRFKCVINAPTPVKFKKTVQINILKIYTLKIKLDSDNDGKMVVIEDGSL